MSKKLSIFLCLLTLVTSCTTTFEVKNIDILGVEENERIEQGSVLYLKASSEPTNALIKWSTSNPSIASIDEFGILKTYGVGEVTITAENGNAKDEIAIQVYPSKEIILDTLKNNLSIKGFAKEKSSIDYYYFEKVVDKSKYGQYFSYLGDVSYSPYLIFNYESYFKDENGLLAYNYIDNNNEIVDAPVDGISYFDDVIISPFSNVTADMINIVSLNEINIQFSETFVDYYDLLKNLLSSDVLDFPIDELSITLNENGSLNELEGFGEEVELIDCKFVSKYLTRAPRRMILPSSDEESYRALDIINTLNCKNYTIDIGIGYNNEEKYVMYVSEDGIALEGVNVDYLEVYSYQEDLGLFMVDVENNILRATSNEPIASNIYSFNPIHFDKALIGSSKENIRVKGGLDPFEHRLVGLDPTYPLLKGKLDIYDVTTVFLNISYDSNDDVNEISFDMLVATNEENNYFFHDATLKIRNIGTTTFPYVDYDFIHHSS